MYDAVEFIDPTPRMPGFHNVRCRISWVPRSSAGPPAHTVLGDYLDADSPGGTVSLGCGIESALNDLGISDLVDYENLVRICDFVSRQLADRPRAELNCPQGSARIELVPTGQFVGVPPSH